jgi:hypothetical protein
MLSRIVLMVALVVGAGCDGGDSCRPDETRCHGDTVEVCDAEGSWVHLADCRGVTASVEPSWQCCEVERSADAGVIHACLPASECSEVAR